MATSHPGQTLADGYKFDDVLKQVVRTRKVTTDVINFFCSLYTQAKELGKQKTDLGNEIKVALLRVKTMDAAPSDCPYKLSLTVTDPKPVTFIDWERIANVMAQIVYGKNYENNPRWRSTVRSATTKTTPESQVRLNEPQANPNYKAK